MTPLKQNPDKMKWKTWNLGFYRVLGLNLDFYRDFIGIPYIGSVNQLHDIITL